MVRDWKRSLSKFALSVGLVCVLASALAFVPLALAESSEPKNVPAAPPTPTSAALAKACWGALQSYYACVNQQSLVYPPNGSGMCNTFLYEWQKCGYQAQMDQNVFQEQARSYWFMRSKEIQQGWEYKLKIAVIGGVLDTLGLVAQKFAYETAQLILTGGDSQEPMFWNQSFGKWIQNVADQASSEFLFNLDQYVQQQAVGTPFAGISLCRKPNPLLIKMSLGMGRLGLLGTRGQCTLSQIAENFETVSDLVQSGDAIQMQRPQFYEGGPANDLSTNLQINSAYLNKTQQAQASKVLEREESGGMRPIADKITGALQYPSILANNSLIKLDPVEGALRQQDKQEDYMVNAFWQAGFEGIGFIALKVFLNTMALGILHKIFDQKPPSAASVNASPEQMTVQYEALKNADAAGEMQNLFERQDFAKALGDFVIPNFNTSVDKDLITELSNCSEPRTRWNCSMDQAMATALGLAAQDGGLTVGKASGVGTENAKNAGQNTGLHPDWELIPESDIKNNSDPSCYQHSYCAGNLKKLRLARIVSVGWEMAANSPYNIKKDGKYVTLGTVIRGFYDCNANGLLDKDHPWCHLIDPNWILTSPRYQCRAQGYGDAIVKELGTRTEECGDMVSCLSSNSNGECTGGYGYCLAEKPVYRFDARECESQYASCRTWSRSDGQQLSALRNTVERGNCSEDNMGCMWYATQRYVTSTASPDGLWVGSLTTGPRVYWDKGIQTCATEGCTKTYRVTPGETALNLVQNGSFEQVTQQDENGTTKSVAFPGWEYESCNMQVNFDGFMGTDPVDQVQSLSLGQKICNPNVGDAFTQKINVGGGRNYVLTLSAKSQTQTEVPVSIAFYMKQPGQADVKLEKAITSYEGCANGWDTASKTLKLKSQLSSSYASIICQFVTPPEADYVVLRLQGTPSGTTNYDAVQLEEGEYSTPFVDGIAEGLKTAFIKIPPQEYGCTGDDAKDNPACKKFARVCRQIDVGCQGYSDVEDQSAPEIPATLSSKDLCPAICAGYGKYEKLASSFDLVRNVDTRLDDPEDQNTEYFIPSLAEKCTLADVGCEAFTSMEAATGTGEQVSYYNELRYCQKPNDRSATYYTWEGSDVTGYQLITWALIKDTDGSPLIKPTGGRLGVIKDSALCNEGSWKDGADPDCRQFYDEKGVAYYRFYSQTVTSDVACTKYRKDDSTQADCIKTGGSEYVPQTKSCMYDALPSLSTSCKAAAGGCRAYLGPTGRNASNVFNETFVATSSLGWFMGNVGTMKFSLSKEAVLVGDTSIKMEPVPANGPINSYMALSLPTTSTLYRISFWAKAASNTNATLSVDGETVGQFPVAPVWRRYEFGPFYAKGTAGQGSTKLQKHCGNFTYSPNATLIAKVTANNSGADADTIQATALATLGALMNNPDIAKNVASLANVCTDDTQCSNLSVYATNNTDVYGTTVKGQCGFAGLAAGVQFSAPSDSKALFVDTLRVDQLNDTQFVRKGMWSVPVACDSTYPEGAPQARAMVGCREYRDRDGNQVFVRSFGSLCNADAIGCKGFIDTDDRPTPYSQSINVKGTAGTSQRADGTARAYEEQYFGDWGLTSKPYRYIYVIDDSRAQCDSGEASCRAFGKPVFTQDRMALATTTNMVDPANTDLYANQQTVYKFDTVLMKDDWSAYLDDNGQPKLACRKDELFCDRYQSGNVTEYFRDPGNHACVWQKVKKMDKNEAAGIMIDGDYGGWFREGTEIPCYPGYQKNGDTFGAYYTGEDPYAGWVGKCPTDQSECTEFVDPNDISDVSQPNGRSYFMINSNKIDTRTCGGTVDPLSGCVLFNNKSLSGAQASSKATYQKVVSEKGAPQSPLDCDSDKGNPYCLSKGRCVDFQKSYLPKEPGQTDALYKALVIDPFDKMWETQFLNSNIENSVCSKDSDCVMPVMDGQYVTYGNMVGKCVSETYSNDSNVIIKVKLDRECSRWMGCRTGETVFDQTQQKYVTQCTQMELCQKNGSVNEDIYCSEFTDRKNEDFLKPGQFVDLQNYSARKVGFGSMDYTGLLMPYAYVLPDIDVQRVGADLLGNDQRYVQYKTDQRLVAKIELGGSIVTVPKDAGFDHGFLLCQDTRTKRYGYIAPGTNLCVLPIAESGILSIAASDKIGGDLTRDVKSIYKEFENRNANSNNSLLQSAMPEPECQLYPEADSPLSNEYVNEWNTKVEPPKAVSMLPGYESFKACSYGEDCSCSYRKARYESGDNMYYSVNGDAPAIGVCVGGENEGMNCVPGGYVPVDASNKILVQSSSLLNNDSGCTGGACMALKDVVVENGRYGYCLERDKTRISEASQSVAPCLSWSPLGVIGGNYDMNHYSPTAGYMPPQGSGEYYCVSGANSQRLFTPSTDSKYSEGDRKYGNYFITPGYLNDLAFKRYYVSYQKGFAVPDITGAVYSGSDEATVGAQTQNMMFACRRTSRCEGYPVDSYLNDEKINAKEGRWIQTGKSFNQSYLEYFIPYVKQNDKGPGYKYQTDEDSYDFKFGLFKFSVKPYAAGSACKWNLNWMGLEYPMVEKPKDIKDDKNQPTGQKEFSCQNYLSQIDSLSQQFYNSFSKSFNGVLDRSSERLLTDEQGRPIRLGCVDNPDNKPLTGSGNTCYFKYWQTGYQYESQQAFDWANAYQKASSNQTAFNFWKQTLSRNYYSRQCQSDKPYFAIRAVFQNVNPSENNMTEDVVASKGMNGPWQFVGFWFTTCMPHNKVVDNPGWLFMQLDIVTTDVCRQVGQVISPYTRESAAFADRVWANGQFVLPVLGLNQGSRNQPFGSALATGEIGHSPMVLGASVPMSAKTGGSVFADSGIGIQPLLMNEQNTWAPLSNLFAKIYKVYRWESSLVNKTDWVCVTGNNQGRRCTPENKAWANHYDGIQMCTGVATCDKDVDVEVKNQNWRCNTLSGVNRGMRCGELEEPRNADPICHNSAVSFALDPLDEQKDPALQNKVQIGLYGACEGTGYLDFKLKPSDLSNLGVCKISAKQNANCRMEIWDVENKGANEVVTVPSCADSHNESTTPAKDLCSPLMKQIEKDAVVKPGLNVDDHLNKCVYNTYDDELETGPSILFGYEKCPAPNDARWYVVPKSDGLKDYMVKDATFPTTIAHENQVLAIVYMTLKLYSEEAKKLCNGSTDGPDRDFGKYIRDFEAYSFAQQKQEVNKYLAPDFPDVSNLAFDPTILSGLRRYWNQYGKGIPAKKAGACDVNVTGPDASDSPMKYKFNVGPFDGAKLKPFTINKCTNSNYAVVNPGERCSEPTDESQDCPTKIEACQNVNPGADLNSNNFFRDTYRQDKSGKWIQYRVPKCGFCTLNKGKQYSDLDPYGREEGFKDTGYCFGFNPLSRCKSDNDCRFTSFEYWGAHDNGKGEGVRFGSSDPNLLISKSDEKQGKFLFQATSNKTRRLPTPLFEDGNGQLMTEVPKDYSYPALWTSLGGAIGNTGSVIDDIFRGLDDSDCHWDPAKPGSNPDHLFDNNHGPLECQEMHLSDAQSKISNLICPIAPMRMVCDRLLQTAEQAQYWVPAGSGCLNRELDYSGVGDDTQDTDFEEFWCKHAYLTEIVDRCYQTCGNMALMMPSAYAQNFDKLAGANTTQSQNRENYRKAAVAPFAVNPLIRTLKSMGYIMDTVNKWGKKDGDDWVTRHWALVIHAFWAQGQMTIGRPGYGDFVTDAAYTFPNTNTLGIAAVPLNTFANFLYDYTNLKEILKIDYGTVFNDSFPWDSKSMLFTGLFPLAFDNSEPVSPSGANPDLIREYDSIWRGFGYSDALVDKLGKVISTYVKFNTTENPHCTKTWDINKGMITVCGPEAIKNHMLEMGLTDALLAFRVQYIKDMQENYFDKTGWGVFMSDAIKDDLPVVEQLKLYPGAVPAAKPAEGKTNRPYTVFVPGHCEPPAGGTDSDSFDGDYYQTSNALKVQKGPTLRQLGDLEDGGKPAWFNSRPFKMNWMSVNELNGLDMTMDKDISVLNGDGFIQPDSYKWTPVSLKSGSGNPGNNIEMPGPVGEKVASLRQTCRCVGGALDGQIVEAEFQCNPRMQPTDDLRNFDSQDSKPDWQYCKPATAVGGDYATAMSQYVGQNVKDKDGKDMGVSTGITQQYINELVDSAQKGQPVPECKQSFGNPDSSNPDQDENSCTHTPGYLSRNDVCKDGRNHCLVTYDLTDPVSVNNSKALSKSQPWAPSATDVSSGLDTFGYISGGNKSMDSREYISWYRPRPPMVAAPDTTKTSVSANAQPAIYLDTFNLNSRPEGTSFYGGGQGLATIQFYAWTAHNQGPIRKIVIDWGDGALQNIDAAQLKNQKPLCNTDRECEFVPGLACSSDADCPPAAGACIPTGNCKLKAYKQCSKDEDCGGDDVCVTRTMFGNSGDACRQGYLEFQHVYRCEAEMVDALSKKTACDQTTMCEGQPDLSCADCRKGEKCVKGLAPTGGCYNTALNRCRFTPKIQVYDNWGWCAGDCSQDNEMLAGGASGAYPVRHPYGGCYDGSSVKINSDILCSKNHPYSCSLPNECDPSNLTQNKTYRPWIVYKGSVEVSPTASPNTGSSSGGVIQMNKLPSIFQKTQLKLIP